MAEIDPNKYIIAIIIVTIFICVSVIIWAIRKFGNNAATKHTAYPPYTSPCPDFWVSVGTNPDGSHKCKPIAVASNKDTGGPGGAATGINGLPACDSAHHTNSQYKNLSLTTNLSYNTSANSPNPNVNFTGMSESTKCKWANKCGVYWEGISSQACEELAGGSQATDAPAAGSRPSDASVY